MSDVELSKITKRYEGVARPVIPELDLVVPSRKMVVLVGPSGCGKSTTLRMVAGLEDPTSGTISIEGRDVTHVPPAERDIAMVFQSYALYPHMTVAENMAFALRIKKVSDSEIKRRVGEVAASLGLEPYLERKPKALSGGQRQRVAIGRAVVRQPKVFLFDEPLSNLDAKLRGDMRREIARIHQMSKATGMYVTHDQIEAMTLGDQIVVLKDGIVQQVGSPVEIYETPANRFVAGFFGTPTMNFLAADLAQTGDRHLARGPGFEIPLSLAPALRPAQSGLDRLRTPSGSAARPGRAEACDRLRTPSGSAARPGRAEACDRVVVGIRPEQLSLTRRSEGVSLRGEVAMREILGAEIVLHLESQSGPLTVRTEAGSAPRPGDTVEVWLDPSRIHVFDGNSEVRL